MKREKVLFLNNIQQFMDFLELGIEKMVDKRNKFSIVVKKHCMNNVLLEHEIDGIYFGNEFCDNLLPSCMDIDKVYHYCEENKIKFSLVLPYVTQEKIKRVEKILEYISDYNMRLEIICNDWGIVHLIYERYPEQKIILGRLLDKMYKDARIDEVEYNRIFEEKSMRYYKNNNIFSESNLEFLKKYRIQRIEIDSPPQGLKLQGCNGHNDIKVSLYINFGFITTGRMCMMRFLDTAGMSKYSLERDCERKCQVWDQVMKKNSNAYVRTDGNFSIGNLELYRKGNTIFYLTNEIEKVLDDNPMIDREIYQLCMPM